MWRNIQFVASHELNSEAEGDAVMAVRTTSKLAAAKTALEANLATPIAVL
jgi:hypothetical protein